MLFTSAIFLSRFLPAILTLYWLAEAVSLRKLQWLLLLVGSLVFYGFWRLDYLPVLLGSIAFNFFMGLRIDAAAPRDQRRLLVCGVAGNLLLLGVFKYTDFLVENVSGLFDLHPYRPPGIALPLGISFFTFTQIAYLVDCANGRRGRHGPTVYSLFVAFFPHLLAGPIIHHSEMIPQFQRGRRSLDVAISDAAEGFALLAIGAAKKLLLADPLAPVADAAFSRALLGGPLDPGQMWMGALAYTFQLYFDFSGYSDMAVGLARIFGIAFPANFNSPYKSASLVEFWRRWHMTLSRWLRDYLYIPLGGNRGKPWTRYSNLLLTMLLGGLWHGARWNFVIWGGLHGLALIINHLFRKLPRQIRPGSTQAERRPGVLGFRLLSWASTFVFVVVTWVFFRATTLTSALAMLNAMSRISLMRPSVLASFSTNQAALLGLAAAIALFGPNSLWIENSLASRRPIGLVAGALAGASAGAALLAELASPSQTPFLYFNF